MELTIATVISILSITFAIITFALNRKDKSNKDVEDENYRKGQVDQKLKDIFDKLEKIERKLDNYDTEIDTKLEKALKQHIDQYHKRGGK